MARKKVVVKQRSQHSLSRRNIDRDALKVLRRLREHNWTAYLVGGGVRDLLLGRKPKDFDISTNAHPNQIKKLFNNCFLIGRRFRLAHIRFAGNKIIEVSTFRRQPDQQPEAKTHESDLYHRRDNTFGTPAEDARRRDFTINGLFYDLKGFTVIDHVGGLPDLKKKIIRSIGDPNIRFREDPVRMVRAVRFASRMGFRIEPVTHKAIVRHCHEIKKAAPARMLEEIYKLFAFQSGEAAFHLLYKNGLLAVMFPEIDAYLKKNGKDNATLWRYLAALDSGEHWKGEPSNALMFATLFYEPLMAKAIKQSNNRTQPLHPDTIESLLSTVTKRYKMPRRVFHELVRVICNQERMDSIDQKNEKGKKTKRFSKKRFVHQESFPASLALLELRTAAGTADPHLPNKWKKIAHDAGPPPPSRSSFARQNKRRKRQRRPSGAKTK